MKKLTISCIVVLFLSSSLAFAQDICSSTIEWQLNEIMDGNRGKFTSVSDKIISHAKNTVEWIDAHGSIKETFTVKEVNGNWTNLQKPGSIVFEVDYAGGSGTIRFSRASDKLVITLMLFKADSNPDVYELYITEYTIL